jgi:Putative beta-barrel porin-2, OmpL-like. bbp2
MLRLLSLVKLFAIALQAFSKSNAEANIDSALISEKSKIEISAYLDFYYGNTFSEQNEFVPYFVNSNSNNEFNINLALLDFKFVTKDIRFKFTPGFGTYMNSNYANEPTTLKNLLEASMGVRLSKKKRHLD